MHAPGGEQRENAKRAAQRRPWDGSTRSLATAQRRHRTDEAEREREHRTDRCTSPACQRRRQQRSASPHPTSTTRQRSGKRATSAAIGESDSAVKSAGDATRAMIERAFDAAMATAMHSAPSPVSKVDSSVEIPTEEFTGPPELPNRLAVKTVDDAEESAASEWRTLYLGHRQQRDAFKQATKQQKECTATEVHSAIGSARLEYERRKLSIQSLRARVEREMQFLQATASALDRREAMLDDAFALYEERVRRELLARAV